jgi:hypothetical protein
MLNAHNRSSKDPRLAGWDSNFHQQWFVRYFELTGDIRAIQRARDWTDAGYGSLVARAFLYQQTGETGYLEDGLGAYYDTGRAIYEGTEGERYDGYSLLTQAAVHSSYSQEAPYFMAALQEAGLTEGRGRRPIAYPWKDVSPSGAFVPLQPAGLSRAGLTLTIIAQPSTADWRLSLRQSPYRDATTGEYHIFTPPVQPGPGLWGRARTALLSGNYASTTAYPIYLSASAQADNGLHAIEFAGGAHFLAPVSVESGGTRPAEAAVIRRVFYQNGQEVPVSWEAGGRALFYARPTLPGPVTLTFDAYDPTRIKDGFPYAAGIEVEDATGALVADTSVFFPSARPRETVPLDPAVHPLPWLIYTTGARGPSIGIDVDGGAEELLLGVTPRDIDEVAARLNVPTPDGPYGPTNPYPPLRW